MTEEPKIRIETREELVFLLAEAATIEHTLMCCYLYAAWSLKRREADGLSPAQVTAVRGWSRAITSVAIEEMTHLALANNLLVAIGAGPHFSRPNFPVPPLHFPAGVNVELARFSMPVLDHFIFLERPEGKELHDATEFIHPLDYHRTLPKGRLMPSAQDYATVGHLYRGIRHGLAVLSHHIGEKALFCGDVGAQLGPAEASLPGLSTISDLASADAAIETIIEQGEGAPSHSENSHFNRFLNVRTEFESFLAADPSFDPAFPVAHNPVMTKSMVQEGRVFIGAAEAARVLDLANSVYGHMLRCLVQAFGRGDDSAGKRLFVDVAIDLMEILPQVCRYLASLPADAHHPGINAGMTFTMLRDIARLPAGPAEMRLMGERVIEMAHHSARLFPPGHELEGTTEKLHRIADRFDVADLMTVHGARRGSGTKAPAPVQPQPAKPLELPSGAGGSSVEIARGRDITIRFDGRRCVHARFCVLEAPKVFLANTPGEWIFPDQMPADDLERVARRCPSGAIQFTRNDGKPQESPPPVNTVNIRENGPYAFHAELTIAGAEDVGFRATLCRCGASKRKPFCDGSHKTIGFVATGEPDTRPSEPLAVRNGPLGVEPLKDGPLRVTGNVEICSGTGRTIDRVATARLCRCGHSRTKPFCDNTHLKIGFTAAGI